MPRNPTDPCSSCGKLRWSTPRSRQGLTLTCLDCTRAGVKRTIRSSRTPRTCEREGCTRKHVAKGLCSSHYNLRYQPELRHRKTNLTCEACGVIFQREIRGRTYKTICCSELCRQWLRRGAWTCKIPSNHPSRLLAKPKRETPAPTPRAIACAWCDKGFTTTLETKTFCSLPCKRRAKVVRRRGREHNAPGAYTWGQVAKLWTDMGKICAYCHAPTPLTAIEPDHVTPLSRGGRNDLGNILPSCKLCNSDKRDLLLNEWNPDRLRRGLQAVHTTWDDLNTLNTHLLMPQHLRPNVR